MIGLLFLIALATPVIGLAQAQSAPGPTSLKVTSSAFSDGGKIPKKYTCDSSNASPPLRIENLPKTAKSLALIVDDPDAPGRTWTHWLLWNIEPKTAEIREDSVPQNAVRGRAISAAPDMAGHAPFGFAPILFQSICTRYHPFATQLGEEGSAGESDGGHIVAKGSLIGTYSREH